MPPKDLLALLDEARALGFLGPGPVTGHVDHARRLGRAVELVLGGPPLRFCDLGAGGGVPGLVLAETWPEATGVLLEASARRCGFLRGALDHLGLADRLVVAQGRAEELARDEACAFAFPLVVSRGFGRPAVAAECGARLLSEGGRLLVTEPPPGSEAGTGPRWPAAGLALLGLTLDEVVADPPVAVLRAARRCPERYPRRVGVPAKRPLF